MTETLLKPIVWPFFVLALAIWALTIAMTYYRGKLDGTRELARTLRLDQPAASSPTP